MALKIDIDTDELQQYVKISKTASEALTQAAELLNSIVVHTDWQCPERDGINENISLNRNDSLKLQADSASFYNAITQCSQEFIAFEHDTNTKINGVDSQLSSFLSLIPNAASSAGASVASGADGFVDSVKNALGSGGDDTGFGSTVDFGNIASAVSGSGGGFSSGGGVNG